MQAPGRTKGVENEETKKKRFKLDILFCCCRVNFENKLSCKWFIREDWIVLENFYANYHLTYSREWQK